MKFRGHILNFRKTEHFLKRQWERSIEDRLLNYALKWLQNTGLEKEILVVHPKVFTRIHCNYKTSEYLVVVVKNRILITCYWCNQFGYIIRNTKGVSYQILNSVENGKFQAGIQIHIKNLK